MNYSYFYDVFVILIFIISVLYGYRKGFLNGVVSIISYIFSFLFANFLGRFFLRSSIFNLLSSFNIFNLNEFLINFNMPIEKNNSDFKRVFENFNLPLSNYLFFWILLFILFIGFKRLFNKLFNLIYFIKKMPIIKNLDGILGAIFGVLEAVIFLIAIAGACFLIVKITNNNLKFLNLKIIESTNLFFLFYKILYFIKI